MLASHPELVGGASLSSAAPTQNSASGASPACASSAPRRTTRTGAAARAPAVRCLDKKLVFRRAAGLRQHTSAGTSLRQLQCVPIFRFLFAPLSSALLSRHPHQLTRKQATARGEDGDLEQRRGQVAQWRGRRRARRPPRLGLCFVYAAQRRLRHRGVRGRVRRARARAAVPQRTLA